MGIKKCFLMLFTCMLCWYTQVVWAEDVLRVVHCAAVPEIDGVQDDAAWENAPELITYEQCADMQVCLRAVYTDDMVYMLVVFPDPDESREHKTLQWDTEKARYVDGPEREDTFVFKWNKGVLPVDLSIYSGEEHRADIWFWKACRTDPVGYADDKQHIVTFQEMKDSRSVISREASVLYLSRPGDSGKAAYRAQIYPVFVEKRMSKYSNTIPTGSRADVRAKGVWRDGYWTIEFARALTTGQLDDIQFFPGQQYQLGISRYEIAGRRVDETLSQPLYGTGDTLRSITVQFER